MSDAISQLPLFPLSSVLYPEGRLRLRIFERRYLDMIRDCARHGREFGVCLIVSGNEVGAPATPAAIGTSARIVDFETLPDGLLGITAEGVARFHVDAVRVRDNGLILGGVQWLPVPERQVVPAEHGLLARLLETLLTRFNALPDDAGRLDDADWVAYRLAEWLPIDTGRQQALLQMASATERLAQLASWLPDLGEETGDNVD